MSDSDDYAEYCAEEYEGMVAPRGGGGAAKKKKKPTQIGKVRCGSTAWVGTATICPKGCAKKCCSTPTLNLKVSVGPSVPNGRGRPSQSR